MITVYTSPTCRYCPLVKQHLVKQGIDYTEVDITKDKDSFQKLWDLGYRTVPVVSNGKQFVAGFDRYRINQIVKEKDE